MCRGHTFGPTIYNLTNSPTLTMGVFTGGWCRNAFGPSTGHVTDSPSRTLKLATGRCAGHTLWASTNELTHSSCLTMHRSTQCRRCWNTCWPTVHDLAYHPLLTDGFVTGRWNWDASWQSINNLTNGSFLAV